MRFLVSITLATLLIGCASTKKVKQVNNQTYHAGFIDGFLQGYSTAELNCKAGLIPKGGTKK